GIGSGPVRPTTPGGVTGQDLGGGYMIEEEAKKTRSTITRDAIDKQGPSANPYQLINLLPGVVQSSTDNTGANGGNIRMRGFNSDHVGLTIEGMPVNDSGNYALYPQEYVDADNIEQISIAQGSPELDSPHIGSAGGVINIYMRDPSKEAGGMTSFSVGSDNYFREFVRVESGQVGPMRAYLSYSRLDKDHWVGEGEDTRDHIDFKAVYDISPGNTIRFSGLYNEAVNNFYRQPNLARFEKEGKNSAAYDSKLPTTFFSGTPLNQASAAQGLEATNYYKYRVNPFKNLILSAPSNFKLTENLRFDTIPYYWYGFGNGGGTGELREAGAFSGNNRITGVDFGGNLGAGTDRILYYNPSITETNRPGVINKFTLDVADHTIVAGHWYEYASHRQTAPFIPLNADGSIAGDVWGEDNNYTLPSTATCRITSTAGSGSGQTAGTVVPCPTGPLQRRDQKTETTTSMFFVGDSWNITNWLKLDAGVKHVSIKRDIANYLPDANPGKTELSDDVTLPTAGVSIQLNKEHQIFGSYAESFRSAPNFTLTAGYSITSGAFTPVTEVEPERGQIYEIGHRYQGSLFATSVSGFYGEFENYQQSTNRIDTASGGTASVFQTINLGGVRNYGVNGEIGTRPIYNFRPYVSGELLRTEILDNLEARTTAGTTDYLRTAGKELPGAPRYSFGVGVDYDNGHFFTNLAYKYTGSQYSTLVNDEEIDGFGRLDAAIGYRFGDIGYMKQPEVKLSLFNVLDSVDLVGVSGVQNNAKVATGVNGGTIAGNTGNFAPTYYVGQDFSALVTFKTGF
ncbi:MAG: TonB-dependent receptor, partial [Hyphomicrobium sp.]